VDNVSRENGDKIGLFLSEQIRLLAVITITESNVQGQR
jgi:hypothetical protein